MEGKEQTEGPPKPPDWSISALYSAVDYIKKENELLMLAIRGISALTGSEELVKALAEHEEFRRRGAGGELSEKERRRLRKRWNEHVSCPA